MSAQQVPVISLTVCKVGGLRSKHRSVSVCDGRRVGVARRLPLTRGADVEGGAGADSLVVIVAAAAAAAAVAAWTTATEMQRVILLALYLTFPKEVATQIAKNCRRRQPHYNSTPPPPYRGTCANIRIRHFWKLESSIIGLHFCR